MLLEMLKDAALGAPPPPDGRVDLLPAPSGPAGAAVVALTAHHVVASRAPEPWLRERLPEGDLLAPMSPPFLAALGERLGLRCDGVDVVLAAEGLAGGAALSKADGHAHPRVVRARAHREDVRVFEGAAGAAVVVLGRGLAGRAEVAFEVDSSLRPVVGSPLVDVGYAARLSPGSSPRWQGWRRRAPPGRPTRP